MSDNTTQVQELYERRPYPHYPLLAKPRWQDGFLGSSLFSGHLIHGPHIDAAEKRRFLSVGSGEILPYVIRQWEPSATMLECVDLSQRSLRRARFRTAMLGRHIEFLRGDINEFLTSPAFAHKFFNQIEAYGVLHHIPSFARTMTLMQNHLAPDGIVRLMVYNSHARGWIWDINRALGLLGLRFHVNQDIAAARTLLRNLAEFSPRLNERLKQLGISSLENDTRFADTFLHPWESRASVKQWFSAIRSAGLKPVALHDRYAELDDLPNPLWQCPTAAQLTERALDMRFENNLELWLIKDHVTRFSAHGNTREGPASRIPVRLRLTMPPHRLSQFSETRDLPFGTKLALWHGFLRTIYNRKDHTAIRLIANLETKSAQRLARMGLILPEMAKAAGVYDKLLAPMTSVMQPPELPPPGTQGEQGAHLARTIEELCAKIQPDNRKAKQASLRLARIC